MDNRLVIASNNHEKSLELQQYFDASGYVAIPYTDLTHGGTVQFPAEGQRSYQENAIKKAQFLHKQFPGEWIVADDSGMQLAAFPGKYGILTARQLRQETNFDDDDVLNNYLAKITVDTGDNGVKLQATLVVLSPAGDQFVSHGCFQGRIEPSPVQGLNQGFDPLLYVPEIGKTFAEMNLEERLKWQHRAIAAAKMSQKLDEV